MRMHIAALVLAGGLIAACGDDGPIIDPPDAPETLAVGTAGPPARFVPATGTVAEGGTVTWTNQAPAAEGIVHDITSDDNLWTKPELESGESFSFTFEEPGSYTYRCTLHAGMTGVIHVE